MIETSPRDRGSGVVDEALSAVGIQRFRQDPCGALYAAAQACPGNTIRLSIGSERVLILQSAEPIARILRDNTTGYRRNFGSFAEVFGESRLTTDGKAWQRLKGVTHSAISGRTPDRIAAITRSRYDEALKRILEGSAQEPILDLALDRAAAGVLLDVAFGLDADALPDRFFDDFRSALDYCASMSWIFEGSKPAIGRQEQAAARAAWRRARKDMADLLIGGPRSGDDSLVDRLLTDEAVADNVISEFATLFFAGSETTSTAMGWLLFLLATHPQLQDQLRRDVQTIEVEHQTGFATRIPTLLSFINEGLRIFPPIPLLSRIAADADNLDGADVRPGDTVIVSIIGLHHDAAIWPSPESLQPGRFEAGEPSIEQRRSFLPFSEGPRVCGGMRFAMTELAVALATLLRRARFDPPSDRTVEFNWRVSLRRAGGHRIPVTAL
jgi:cytochrome P450